ncbi:MAG: hypothetical protein OIF32_06055 [Campylobacterales bacterium]|nr:hypothetical protein [Campylobacterales bacterium]
MQFGFIITSEKEKEKIIKWLQSVGITWITKEKIDDEIVKVDFINTPTILHTLTQLDSRPSICAVSEKGVSFYVTDIALGKNFKFELKGADGVIFIPMNNIISISTVGNIINKCR